MPNDRTVVVCDDHPIFRSGVVQCLKIIPGLDVVAEASDVASAIGKLEIYDPDILVSDLSMPGQNGFELLEWVTEHKPETVTIVLSMHTELAFVKRAQALGARGFLAKEDAEIELAHAVATEPGRFYTSESIGRPNALPTLQDNSLGFEMALKKVSPAEMKILVQLSLSKTNKEIADTLNLSPRTVEAHRHSLADKLDAKGPNKLLELAIKFRDLLEK